MLDTKFQLENWTLNTVYDKIYNCRVVKPTYEVNGLYSDKFMLDKRHGSVIIPALDKPGYSFLDTKTILWEKYYLAENTSKFYLFHEDGTLINSTGIDIDSSSPAKLLKTKWAWWTLIKDWVLLMDSEALDDVTSEWLYDGWWIKLKVTWCSIWQYIVFNDWLLKWATNRIEHIEGDFIYIIGTNTRGTLPTNWQTYKVYAERRETLLIGWVNGLYLFNLNWSATNNTPILILPVPVIDMTIFNGQVLALSDVWVYYSKSTYDDNTNIYPRDLLKWYSWMSLINIWTAVLAMGDTPELIKDIVTTDWSIWYVSHQLEITSAMHSKYSYIYKDWVFMMLTDSHRLPTVNIQSINNTLSKTVFNYSDSVFRWLFEVMTWDVYVNNDWIFSHMITHKDWKTTIYELDFEYKHWIIHEYDFLIYKKIDNEILWDGWVYSIEWFQDRWEEYQQEINFSLWDSMEIISPLKGIRTIIWMSWQKINLLLQIVLEFGVKLITIDHVFKDYDFEIPPLLWLEDEEEYNGTLASFQKSINRTWRFVRFRYRSLARIIFWESMVFYELKESKLTQELDTSE